MSCHQTYQFHNPLTRLLRKRILRRLSMVALAISAASLAGCGASSNSITGAGLTAGDVNTEQAFSNSPDVGSAKKKAARKAAERLVSVNSHSSTAYKIGPLDMLAISVYKVPELSKTVQVADTGTVNLPLVGEVAAAGSTARHLEKSLEKKLGVKYLQNPQVTVNDKEYNSRRVTVEGSVKKPGVYPIMGNNSLIQFIAMAGGLDENSDSTVLVLRTTDGKRSAAKFDMSDIRSGQAKDPVIQSGDVIVANASSLKKGFNAILKAIPIAGAFALL